MFNSVSFLQIKHILTKKNFEMHLRAGKTDRFSVFHVENGKIQSMLRFYVVFQCINTYNLGSKQTFSTIYVRFL